MVGRDVTEVFIEAEKGKYVGTFRKLKHRFNI
jgi:hypothetical protein